LLQKIVILGTRWLAEEVFDLISDIPGCEVTAFVENMDRERCEMSIEGLPVVWVDELHKFKDTHLAVCALGSTKRGLFIEEATKHGIEFATIVHPTARISSRCQLGEGCIVGSNSVLSTHAALGKHVFLNRGVLIGHHVRIGDLCSIQCGANIAGLAELGERTYVGMSAVILDRVSIGSDCVIGAGAVVTSDLPNSVQAMGVPAQIVKTEIEGK